MKKLLLSFFLICFSIFSYSGTVVVTNTNDSGAGSLRASITSASSGDTIRFSPSLIIGGSDSIVLSSAVSFSKNLIIKGLYNLTDTLYLSGGNSTKIFIGQNFNSIVLDSLFLKNSRGAISFTEVDSVLIDHSYFVNNNSGRDDGGAIYIYSSKRNFIINIKNTNIINNKTSEDGGGIHFFDNSNNGSGSLLIENCKISGNIAHDSSGDSDGGGIFAFGNYNNYQSTLVIKNSIIDNNSANRFGGAIEAFSLNTTISNSEIYNNTGKLGVIHSGESSSGSTRGSLDIINSKIPVVHY